MDRFGDFVSDQVRSFLLILFTKNQPITQVVAPVRETVSQTLASLLIHMPRRSVLHVHSILLQMIKQDFTTSSGRKIAKLKGEHGSHRKEVNQYVWEVRHAGLLGIKYEVAVRSDLVEEESVKQEVNEGLPSGKDVLKGIVDAAVLG